MRLLYPDLNSGSFSESWSTKQSNFFFFCQSLWVLSVEFSKVSSLSFAGNMSGFSDVDVHNQILLVTLLIQDRNADHLVCLLVLEFDLSFNALVVLALLGRSLLGAVGDRDGAAGAGNPHDLELEGADTLRDLGLALLEAKEAAVVVVQDHDGGLGRDAELDGGRRDVVSILVERVHVGDGQAVLAAQVGQTDVEVLVLLKDVVVLNGEVNKLLSLAGSKGEGADSLSVVAVSAGGAVLGLVVDLYCGVEVSAHPDDGDGEGADALHDGVVGRVEHDAHHAVVLLDGRLGLGGRGLLGGGLFGLGLRGQL